MNVAVVVLIVSLSTGAVVLTQLGALVTGLLLGTAVGIYRADRALQEKGLTYDGHEIKMKDPRLAVSIVDEALGRLLVDSPSFARAMQALDDDEKQAGNGETPDDQAVH